MHYRKQTLKYEHANLASTKKLKINLNFKLSNKSVKILTRLLKRKPLN